MIASGRILKCMYALEVAIILLQGVDIEQDVKTGIEWLRIAEPDADILALTNQEIFTLL